jgi:hypothetical protein
VRMTFSQCLLRISQAFSDSQSLLKAATAE